MLAHYEEIRKHAQATGRRVLEFGLGDEWGALCEFLDVEVPPHPYPRENDRSDWIEKMHERARLRAKAVAIKLVGLCLPIAVLGSGVVLGVWPPAFPVHFLQARIWGR